MWQDVGNRIRNRREALGLTQVELAKKINCGQPYISDIEGGKSFSIETALAIVRELKMKSLDVLFGCEESPKDQPPPPPIPPVVRSGRDRREPLRVLFDELSEKHRKKLRGGRHMRIRERLFKVVREELLEKGA